MWYVGFGLLGKQGANPYTMHWYSKGHICINTGKVAVLPVCNVGISQNVAAIPVVTKRPKHISPILYMVLKITF